MIQKIEAKSFRIWNTTTLFSVVCEANNGFLASCYHENSICFINNEDEIEREIEKLDGKEFQPVGITANKVDRAYIADYLNNRVIATNFSLDFLNSIEIQKPCDVFFDAHLYICTEKQISRCNEDFTSMVVFDMNLPPLQIRIVKERSIVRFHNKIVIYDSETFTKLFKTINFTGDICNIDEFFILSRGQSFEVYNLDGDLVEHVEDTFEEISISDLHGLDICNNRLILTTSFKQLIIIDLN